MDTSTFLLTRSQLEERMEARRLQDALEHQEGNGKSFLSHWGLPLMGMLLMNGSKLAPTLVRGLLTASIGRAIQTGESGNGLRRWLPRWLKRWI
jgi:hypothetical protein